MKTEEEIQSKLDDVVKALEGLSPDNDHFKTVFEAQKYILEWTLQSIG